MATVKTDISLTKSLLDRVETLAKEMKISRNRLFVMAMEDFIQRHQSQRLLEQINAVYEDEPDLADQNLISQMRLHHRKIVENEW
jgi:metal-responsive CopG/Arc/MetJ family transcriptional regulator